MSTANYVLAVPGAGVDRLVEAAKTLSGRVVAVVVGGAGTAEAVAAAGVDECIWIECPADVAPEAFAGAVAEVVGAEPGAVIAGRDPASRVLLGAAAAAIGAPVLIGMVSLDEQDGSILVTHGVYGGIAKRTLSFDGPVALLLDGGGTTAVGEAVPVSSRPADGSAITVIRTETPAGSSVDLSEARRVLGVGTGLKSREDLGIVEAAAAALGAEVGCTRPLAEGLEWLAKDRYIGISGKHIAPDLYLAAGISGQLQHMAGVRAAGTIVAINPDTSAPIANDADFFVAGDLYELLPAIAAELS